MKRTDAATVWVAEAFGQPLKPRSVPLPDVKPGGALVRLAAAGVCGSDLDIIAGDDPRIRLPLVPGHEGVGWIESLAGPLADINGEALRPGDLVTWNRGLSCGACYECAVMRQPALCPNRRVYGINIRADDPPGLNGCYATHIYLRPGTQLLKLPPGAPPPVVVPATCSGATAAHAVEQAAVDIGDVVVVLGPGPLGLFAAALAMQRGAEQVIVFGTRRGAARLAIARSFGCTTVNIHDTTADERLDLVRDLSHGRGADVVIDAAGRPDSVREALRLVARGGRIALPGVATPIGRVPVAVYEELAVKNVSIHGTWVSDARHLRQAVAVALSGRFNLDAMVATFALSAANQALDALRERRVVKAVLVPD